MTADDVRRALTRISHEIVEKHGSTDGLALVGIQTRGVPLAERLAAAIETNEGVRPPVGSLDITFHRDDVATDERQPRVKGTDLPFALESSTLVIVDDVLYTGRTVRAALDELADFGRPARIALAVLVDRGGRELPIHADIVGKKIDVRDDERIDVLVEELDGKDSVVVVPREGAE